MILLHVSNHADNATRFLSEQTYSPSPIHTGSVPIDVDVAAPTVPRLHRVSDPWADNTDTDDSDSADIIRPVPLPPPAMQRAGSSSVTTATGGSGTSSGEYNPSCQMCCRLVLSHCACLIHATDDHLTLAYCSRLPVLATVNTCSPYLCSIIIPLRIVNCAWPADDVCQHVQDLSHTRGPIGSASTQHTHAHTLHAFTHILTRTRTQAGRVSAAASSSLRPPPLWVGRRCSRAIRWVQSSKCSC